jgi:hypothetical protein
VLRNYNIILKNQKNIWDSEDLVVNGFFVDVIENLGILVTGLVDGIKKKQVPSGVKY